MDDKEKTQTQLLEELEDLRQALRCEKALSRVRSRILAMRFKEELREALETAWVEELRGLGLRVEGVSLQRPASEGRFFSHSIFNRITSPWAVAPASFAHLPSLEDFPWVKQAWERGEPVVVDRTALDQSGRFGPQTQSLLEVPLRGVGSIGLNSLYPETFDPKAVGLVQLFVGLIAEGLQRLEELGTRERESQIHQAVVDTVIDGIITINEQGIITSFNPAAERIFGYTALEMLGRNVRALMPEPYHSEHDAHLNRYLQTGEKKVIGIGREVPARRKDGSTFVMELGVSEFLLDGQRMFTGCVRDITERNQISTTLRDGQERLRVVLETVGDPIFVKDNDHRIILANRAFYEMFGLHEETVLGFTLAEHVPLDERVQFLAVDRQVLDTGIPDLREESLTVNGVTRTIVTRKTRFVEASGARFLVGSIHDITERKHLEQELVRTQRLRAVGELSAGICHNLNNLLTGMMGPAELLQMTSNDPRTQHLSSLVVEAGSRAAELVHRLHRSVRLSTTSEITAVALNPAIEEMLRMTRPKWRDAPQAKGIAIEVRTDLATVPPVKGNWSEVHDLLTNLLFNAVDALPQGGLITIETTREDDLVRLDFSDTGVGMSEATRLRIFEPFFTTKMDVGSGLGLSTLHNSMTQWGGTVMVASTLGKGTTFTLRLPVWQEAIPVPPVADTTIASRPGRVLVVEDDQIVARILKEVLSTAHQVEIFSTGAEALAQLSAGKYDVAIIDLGLPGIPGDQIAQRLMEIDPTVARIMFSGWELETGDPRGELFDFVLKKPLRDLRTFEVTMAQAIVLRDHRAGIA